METRADDLAACEQGRLSSKAATNGSWSKLASIVPAGARPEPHKKKVNSIREVAGSWLLKSMSTLAFPQPFSLFFANRETVSSDCAYICTRLNCVLQTDEFPYKHLYTTTEADLSNSSFMLDGKIRLSIKPYWFLTRAIFVFGAQTSIPPSGTKNNKYPPYVGRI